MSEATREKKALFSDLLGKSVEDLAADLKAAKEELFRLRFQLALKQLEDTSRIGACRHRIAQLSDAIRRKEREVAQA
ncbi:MAG: 50S ribosomal protein L29 [Candidatus Sericytochromatia bacterium]|nr:50S ribosomal protein L29 [Candidatus Sericytochromatia bacterium]